MPSGNPVLIAIPKLAWKLRQSNTRMLWPGLGGSRSPSGNLFRVRVYEQIKFSFRHQARNELFLLSDWDERKR